MKSTNMKSGRSVQQINAAITAVLQPLEKRVLFSAAAITTSDLLLHAAKKPAKAIVQPLDVKAKTGTKVAVKTASKATAKTTVKTITAKKPTAALLTAKVQPNIAGFTAGDLVVYQVGTGSGALTSASTAVYLDEYSPSGTLVQSIPLPTTGNNPLTASGTATGEGLLNLSPSGENLFVPGYDVVPGTASITTSATIPRGVDTVGSGGTVASSTTLGAGTGNGLEGGNIDSAVGDDTGDIWALGSKGVVYTTAGSNSTATPLATPTSPRYITINNGQLYIGTDNYATGTNASKFVDTLGTGLPTSGSPSINPLPGTINNDAGVGAGIGGAYAYAFATLNGGSSPDTIYVADSYNGSVEKFSYVSGSWVASGNVDAYATGAALDNVRGIVAEPSATGEQLYFDTTTNIYALTDTTGFDGNLTLTNSQVTPLSIASAATNTGFRGLAFVPQSSLSIATNPVSSVTQVEGRSAALYSAVAAGTDATVQWQVNAGSGWTYISNGTDANGVAVSGATSNTLTLGNLSLAESGYKYQAVFTDPSGTFTAATSSAETVNVTFKPGDLIVEQAGTAASPESGSATAPVVLDEYTPAGTLVSSTPLPTTTSGSNNPLTVSGSNTSEGEISLSSNAENLLVPGYDAAAGTASVTSSSSILRDIGVVSATGSINTSTTLGTGLEGGNIYSVASPDGTNLYAAGSKGIVNTTVGSTANATLLTSQNTYGLTINNGQLYDSADLSGEVLSTVGTGLPTTAGQTVTKLTGVTFSGTSGQGVGYSREFAFANLSGGATADTLYAADSYNDDIDKLSLVNGSWVFNGAIGAYGSGGNPLASVEGIAVEPVAGGEQIFVSIANTTTGTSKIETITDPYGFNSAGPTGNSIFSGTPSLTTIATGNGAISTPFKGVAFAPQTSLTVTNSPASSVAGAVGNSTTLFAAVAAGTDATVQWQVNTGSGFVNLSNGTDANGETVAGVTTNTLTLGNLSASDSGYIYRALFTDPSGTFSSVTSGSEALTISNTPVVSAVSPDYDFPTSAGYLGKTVTITGSNFTGASSVNFGTVSVPASQFTVNAAGTTITVTDPSEAAGAVPITVIANGNTSATSNADLFYYEVAPTVTGVSPATGTTSGGDAITITGTGFIPGSTVSLVPTSGSGGTTAAATSVVVVSPTLITAVTPADAGASTIDVEVTSPQGTSPANPGSPGDTFTYTPTTIAAAEADTVGSVVTLDDNPVITAVLSVPTTINGDATTNYEILAQDSSGSAITLFGTSLGTAPNNTYIPAVGDTVQVTGTTSTYHGIYELGSITAITKTGTAAVPAPLKTFTANQLNVSGANVPASFDDKLVELQDITISSPPAGSGLPALPPNWGAVDYTGEITDSSNTSANPLELYYWPSSYSTVDQNFYGVAVPTAPVNYIGFVQIYTSNGVSTPEFIPLEQVDGNGNPVSTDLFTASTNEPAISSNTLAETDNFDEAQRGDTFTVTVSRNESATAATIGYQVNPNSALAGNDYDAGTGAPATSGTLNFPTGTSTQTFTITVNPTPGDSGDKDFSIDLLNAQESTQNSGYVASIGGGPINMLIHDPNSLTTEGNVSTPSNSLNEDATIQAGGAETTTSAGTTTLLSNKINIETPNNTQGGSAAYALLNFNDQGDTYDSLTTVGGTGAAGSVETIDGIELETFASPEYYDQSGTLNVYVIDNSSTIPASDYTATGLVNGQGAKYTFNTADTSNSDGSSDGVGGTVNSTTGVITGSSLGTLYPLGSIAYNEGQLPTGYTPFNLTKLNATGVYQLAKDISNGGDFTLVVTPGDGNVTATWGGSTNAVSDQSPILRVNYTNTLPTWATATTNTDNSSPAVWIVPTSTLAVGGSATITSDPLAADGDLPNIVDGTAGSVVSVTTPTTSPVDVHLGGITLSNGADLVVASFGAARTYQNHDVLVIGAENATTSPTFSIGTGSELDLQDNDMIIHNGGADFAAVQALAQEGRNAPATAGDPTGVGNGPDGTWTGEGLTSSVATTNDAADNIELNVLAVTLNSDMQLIGNGFTRWNVGTAIEPLRADGNDVIVKYTYYGDANLEGYVGTDSVATVNGNYTGTTSLVATGYPNVDWAFGDFDGSGEDNSNDAAAVNGFYGIGGDGTDASGHTGQGFPQL